MSNIYKTNFNFPGQISKYEGKVRDVYAIEDNILVVIASDRISAFDIVMPKPIPYKGQVLNQISLEMLKSTEDIIDNWLISSPDPNVSIGHRLNPIKIEMVIRGYLSGHSDRVYKSGKRSICGVKLENGLVSNQKFNKPIITPSTKADVGHDEDDSDNKLYLIDEIHTPDSSRYFYIDGYQESVDDGIPPKQLSKEFFRQWLIKNNFQGKENQNLPEITREIISDVSNRYIELFDLITGNTFKPRNSNNILKDLENNITDYLT